MAGIATLTSLPNETVLSLLPFLSGVDLTCLALASHQFYTLVLQFRGINRLRDLNLPQQNDRILISGFIYAFASGKSTLAKAFGSAPYGDLMERLLEWMGPNWVYCGQDGKSYVRNANNVHIASDHFCLCAAMDNLRKQAMINQRADYCACDGADGHIRAVVEKEDAKKACQEFAVRAVKAEKARREKAWVAREARERRQREELNRQV